MRYCPELRLYLAVGMPEKETGTGAVYNSVIAVSPEGVDAVYRKIHPFGNESLWCKKGQAPVIWQTPWGGIGLGICYDTYQFPELLRYYAAQGCRLYLNCTAQAGQMDTPQGRERMRQYYLSTLEAASLGSEIFLASSNLAGEERGTQFGGASSPWPDSPRGGAGRGPILQDLCRRTGEPGDRRSGRGHRFVLGCAHNL